MSIRLIIEQLAIGYQEPIAELSGVELAAGQMNYLIGPNGAGKTTLFKTLAGLIPSRDAGRLKLGDIGLDGMPLSERSKQVAYMHSEPVRSRISVRDYFQIGLQGHITWRKKARGLEERLLPICARLKITELLPAMVNRLSAGEFQKVLIALTIARECPVMLFDEPFAHLDPPSQVEVHALFKQLAEEYVLWTSTHDLGKIQSAKDKVYLLSPHGDFQVIENQRIETYQEYQRFYR